MAYGYNNKYGKNNYRKKKYGKKKYGKKGRHGTKTVIYRTRW